MLNTVSDWRLNIDTGKAISFPVIETIDCNGDGERNEEVRRLFLAIAGRDGSETQFAITTEDGRYRVQRVNEHVYALRKISRLPYEPNDLGFHSMITAELLREDLKAGGLVLISGPPGAGKTTTASTCIDARLKTHGGYCLAIEDPIEYELDGFHGAGYCDQVEAKGPADYRLQVVTALRKFPARIPGILYLGEVRDSVTAREAFKIGIAGFLVVTTLHSVGLIASIQRLLTMMGGEESSQARSVLANGLRLVLHQHWDYASGRLLCEMLPVSDLVRGAIKNGKLDAIKDELYRVRMRMQGKGL